MQLEVAMEFVIGLVVLAVFVIGFRFLAGRSESHNEYLDETEDRTYKTPPASGGYTGF